MPGGHSSLKTAQTTRLVVFRGMGIIVLLKDGLLLECGYPGQQAKAFFFCERRKYDSAGNVFLFPG
jgi:hypothetical protein